MLPREPRRPAHEGRKPNRAAYHKTRRSVAAWLHNDDYDALRQIADANRVSVSIYLQAIIADVLAEEMPRLKRTA